MATLRIPSATYRLQLNAHLRFDDVRGLVDYLDQLGITDIYSSPLLQARRGSLHGYDVTDPSHINSEIGSEQELEAFTAKLQDYRMGLLLDIVPNHMAASSENPWWTDVLEDGPGSAYASFFDIDWRPPRTMLRNKVLLPILGRPYAQALENQELQLVFGHDGFFIQLYETRLPIAPKTYLMILQYRLSGLETQLGSDHADFRELVGICAAAKNIPERVALSIEMAGERRMRREALKERLWRLHQESPQVRDFIDENVRIFNGRKGKPASFVLLDRLLSGQAYVLSYWLSANDEINYRRFFTISNLVGVRVEDPLVFEAAHAVIFRLIERGLVTGLRIDHVDGMRDPHAYLRRLQERIGGIAEIGSHPPFYVVVEKILAPGEILPGEWPICGATGYASLNALNGLFVDAEGCRTLSRIYESFIGATVRYEDLVYEKKKEVMESLLAVEMRSLGHHLALLAEEDRYSRDLPRAEVARALTETTACFPVYRTYIRSSTLNPYERHYVEKALATAQQRNPKLDPRCFDFVSEVLMLRERSHVTAEQREARLAFIMRWQQFTSPIMAKGVEDSVLYVYNRLISLNEVGGAPDSSGVSAVDFDAFCRSRQKHGHTINATTTHDTKRAEDVRARINVLSEFPDAWERKLRRWAGWNKPKKKLLDGREVPDANEEVLLYQTMLGAWPLDESEVAGFKKRLQDYMVKAAREARVHTDWTSPNLHHEQALVYFIKSITAPGEDNAFLPDFQQWCREIAYYGAFNSLSQLLLKLTMPGVPDIYQGSELWDFRLVDPDNRGPVDFEKRRRLLTELQRQEGLGDRLEIVHDLLEHWQDGRIKLFLISRSLNFRRAHDTLFREGAYQSLEATGKKKENVFAFVRQMGAAWALTAVPRLITQLATARRPPLGEKAWGTSALLLPRKAPAEWVNVLTGERLKASTSKHRRWLPMAEVFGHFPVALLASGCI